MVAEAVKKSTDLALPLTFTSLSLCVIIIDLIIGYSKSIVRALFSGRGLEAEIIKAVLQLAHLLYFY